MQTNRKFVNCDCGTHSISVESDKEIKTIFISFWNQGHINNSSLWNRFKTAFQIITIGTAYADMVCLTTEETLKLHDILNRHIKEIA